MPYLRWMSTQDMTYTPATTVDPQPIVTGLTVYDDATEVDLGTPTDGVLTVQSADTEDLLYHTLRFDWLIERSGQVLTDPEWVDVLDFVPAYWPTTLKRAKDYLRVSGTDDDMEIALLLEAAGASVLHRVGPIDAESVIESIPVGPNTSTLNLKNTPVSVITSVIAPDGTDYTDSLTANLRSGILLTDSAYEERVMLQQGTWVVTYTGGLSVRDDYPSIRSRLIMAVLYELADAFDNRNPRATSDKSGTVARAFDNSTALSPRAERICAQIVGPVIA